MLDLHPPRVPLFVHALRLHRLNPDEPLFHWGHPLPDHAAYRARAAPLAREERGEAVAAVLARHLAAPAPPAAGGPADDLAGLADELAAIGYPPRDDPSIAEVVRRSDAARVRRLGRTLVRRSLDRIPVQIGLTLLAASATETDVPFVQTIGLLSHLFGGAAVQVLERQPGHTTALLWVAERSDGWGRVHAVQSLLRSPGPRTHSWLLRQAVDGDHLNRYFAGDVAEATGLHLAVAAPDADAELVDHAGRVLRVMAESESMGLTLSHYAHAHEALSHYVAHAARLPPSIDRFVTLHTLANGTSDELAPLFAELLERPGWLDGVRARLGDPDEPWHRSGPWAADKLGVRLDRSAP
ncbi:hypothetical protein ACWGI8_01495 [Streptomyces sp. NPDC054841]